MKGRIRWCGWTSSDGKEIEASKPVCFSLNWPLQSLWLSLSSNAAGGLPHYQTLRSETREAQACGLPVLASLLTALFSSSLPSHCCLAKASDLRAPRPPQHCPGWLGLSSGNGLCLTSKMLQLSCASSLSQLIALSKLAEPICLQAVEPGAWSCFLSSLLMLFPQMSIFGLRTLNTTYLCVYHSQFHLSFISCSALSNTNTYTAIWLVHQTDYT